MLMVCGCYPFAKLKVQHYWNDQYNSKIASIRSGIAKHNAALCYITCIELWREQKHLSSSRYVSGLQYCIFPKVHFQSCFIHTFVWYVLMVALALLQHRKSCLPDEEASSFRGRHLHHQNITIYKFVHIYYNLSASILGLPTAKLCDRKVKKGRA